MEEIIYLQSMSLHYIIKIKVEKKNGARKTFTTSESYIDTGH